MAQIRSATDSGDKPSVTPSLTKQFKAALATYKRDVEASMTSAVVASNLAMRHAKVHGDAVFIQRMHDAIPANYGRKDAFVRWVVMHSPFKLSNKLFVKDDKRKDSDWNLDEAFKVPFYDTVPVPTIVNMTADTVYQALTGLVRRAEKALQEGHADPSVKASVAVMKNMMNLIPRPGSVLASQPEVSQSVN